MKVLLLPCRYTNYFEQIRLPHIHSHTLPHRGVPGTERQRILEKPAWPSLSLESPAAVCGRAVEARVAGSRRQPPGLRLGSSRLFACSRFCAAVTWPVTSAGRPVASRACPGKLAVPVVLDHVVDQPALVSGRRPSRSRTLALLIAPLTELISEGSFYLSFSPNSFGAPRFPQSSVLSLRQTAA